MANTMTFFVFCTLVFFVAIVKSSPTTIKLDNGQIYSCVDFYKQPAFGDLSLNLEALPNLTMLQQQKSVTGFGIKGRGCPIGTVPILQHSQLHAREYLGSHRFPSLRDVFHCTAKVQTRANDPNKKFFGANAAISIYKPSAQRDQWSSARIKLLNGGDSIEAGWMVNQDKFNDKEAHLYAMFNGGGKGCINLDCPGFVQVSTDIPLGISPNTYSSMGGQQITWNLSIDKHQDDGNWWLSIKAEKHQIGYWPNNLFTSLRNNANQVEFGGEIYDVNQKAGPTDMGNGYMAAYDTKLSSCFFHATVVNEGFQNINPPDTEKYSDCNSMYTVLDGGYHDDPNLGRLIFYGGPRSR